LNFKRSSSKHGVVILRVNVWFGGGGGREFRSAYVDLAVGSGSEVKSELGETEEWVLSSRCMKGSGEKLVHQFRIC
jgi:hypothetical protein